MFIPGYENFKEGRLNDGARDVAIDCSPFAISRLIADSLSAFYDWLYEDLYGRPPDD